MKKLSFITVLFTFLVNCNSLYSQSLESQLKIFFGSELQNSKTRELRFIGKALSLSGNMQNEFERIREQNTTTSTQNINLNTNYPNTYRGSDGNIYPSEGYRWENPAATSDYRVVRVSRVATLPQYNMGKLKKDYYRCGSNDYAILTGSFTYNWWNDLNNDGFSDFTEYSGVKKSFVEGEVISLHFGYNVYCNYCKGGRINVSINIKVFTSNDGRLIAEEKFNQMYFREISSKGKIIDIPLGTLPAGKYIYAISMHVTGDKSRDNRDSFLRDEFEVLE
jgi:hypothetical protein